MISADRLVISKMTTKDIDEVLAIERQSYQRRGQKRFYVELTSNLYAHYFTARIDGTLVGYFGMWVFFDNPYHQYSR